MNTLALALMLWIWASYTSFFLFSHNRPRFAHFSPPTPNSNAYFSNSPFSPLDLRHITYPYRFNVTLSFSNTRMSCLTAPSPTHRRNPMEIWCERKLPPENISFFLSRARGRRKKRQKGVKGTKKEKKWLRAFFSHPLFLCCTFFLLPIPAAPNETLSFFDQGKVCQGGSREKFPGAFKVKKICLSLVKVLEKCSESLSSSFIVSRISPAILHQPFEQGKLLQPRWLCFWV